MRPLGTKDGRANGTRGFGLDDAPFVLVVRISLLACHQARPDPDGVRPQSERRNHSSPVGDAPCRNDGNGGDGIHDRRDQREGRRGAAIVPAGLRPLHDDRIDTAADRLACLLQRADLHPHVHACAMQAADERLRGIIPEEADHRNLLLTTDI